MAPRSGEEGRSAYARWPVGPRAPRPYGRIGFSRTIDSGTAARPGNPRRLPGIGDETTLNTMWDRTGENQVYVRQQKAAEEQKRFDKGLALSRTPSRTFAAAVYRVRLTRSGACCHSGWFTATRKLSQET